jgi:hypothetical protein
MREELKYFGIIVMLLAFFGGVHNVFLSASDARDFGYCTTTIDCAGIDAGGMCLGAEQQKTECHAPETADHYRRVEAECGILADNYCNDGSEGMEWASNATYLGKTCQTWAEQDDRIDLLSCSETFPTADRWASLQ